jgi:hypothetical protein
LKGIFPDSPDTSREIHKDFSFGNSELHPSLLNTDAVRGGVKLNKQRFDIGKVVLFLQNMASRVSLW